MNEKVRWLHISDIHCKAEDYNISATMKSFINFAKKYVEENGIPDFLFITGDLVHSGKKDQYLSFSSFIMDLWISIGGDIESRTFIVPGNHDLDRELCDQIDALAINSPQGHYFEPSKRGAIRRKTLLQKFENYESFLTQSLPTPHQSFANESGSTVHRHKIQNTNCDIILLNTAWLAGSDSDKEKLTPGKQLIDNAIEKCGNSDVIFVLGHHPISWMQTDDQNPIAQVLADNRVVYIHGHMHNADAVFRFGGKNHFLQIQCGALFQCTEKDKQKNGFMFGEYSKNTDEVILDYYEWSYQTQRWVSGSGKFHNDFKYGDKWKYHLGSKQKEISPPESVAEHTGWQIIASDDLVKMSSQSSIAQFINYFDGAFPSWEIVASGKIPNREIVNQVLIAANNAAKSDGITIINIASASCEGKSTALKQAACKLAQDCNGKRIIFRDQSQYKVDFSSLRKLITLGSDWIVVIDDADSCGKELHSFCLSLSAKQKKNLIVIIAARDADWKMQKHHELQWEQAGKYAVLPIRSLSISECKSIVESWEPFGDEGLRKLSETEPSLRPNSLFEFAASESASGSNAFFGALLQVRFGDQLLGHAKSILEKLDCIKISAGTSLGDAIFAISVMESNNLDYLSKIVLADYLCVPKTEIYRRVIQPLGNEAAATATGTFVYTRHKKIAEAIVRSATTYKSDSADDIIKNLGKSAIHLHDEREFIPKLQGWRYEIPEYFFASHSEDLAIEYAAYCLAKSPNDPMLLTNLSKFYRLSKQPEKSIELLIDNIPHHSNDRGSVTELGVSYKYNKQYYNSIAMLAYSISTERSYLSPTATDIKIAFGSIVECIAEMKDVYITEDFEKQYIAAITVAGNLRNLKRNDIQSAVHELNMWVNEILTTRISLEASNILGNLQILRLLE